MDIMKYACEALVEIKLSLTEALRPFKHSHLGSFYMIGYRIILTQFSIDPFQNILKFCIWSFDEDEIDIDRIVII